MKARLLVLFALLFPLHIFTQNITNVLPNFDRTGMQTAILYNGSGISDITDYNTKTHTVYSFLQAYKALSFSDFEQRFLPFETLKHLVATKILDEPISLGLVHAHFETLKPEATHSGILIKTSNGQIARTETATPIFNQHTLLVAAPLKAKHKGMYVTYRLDSNVVMNTTDYPITAIRIDFDNGAGLLPVPLDTTVPIAYTEVGKKTLRMEIDFADGSTKQSQSVVTIDYSNADLLRLFNRRVTTFTSTNTAAPNLTAYGEPNYKGVGEYELFLSDDAILDKPIFLVDGFDPGDGRNIQSIYELLNFDSGSGPQNLGDALRAEGFDVVILNFPSYVRTEDATLIDGGADYIERNAMLLVELLGIINAEKVGSAQNVIIGPSMGGLISRYALNFMENQSLPHDTRLWISFDAPHLGANVPIGFQHLFNYLAYGLDTWVGDFSVEALKPVVDGMLKSAAGRQMLTDQFETHLQNGSIAEFDNSNTTPSPHPYFNLFFNSMNGLTATGYPEQLRNVSMINGSGIGSPYYDKDGMAMVPGRKVLDAFIEDVAILTDAYLDAWYTPDAGVQNSISEVWIDAPFLCFCDITTEAFSTSFGYSDGIDTASGGLFDISELAADFTGTDPLIDAFLEAMQTNYFNFIPSVSAMALQNDGAIDWFHPIDLGDPNTRTVENVTPFVNWYMPDANENHITLTQANVDFAISEIMPETLGTNTLTNTFLKLEQNPVRDGFTLLSSAPLEQVSLTITDVSGKVVFNTVTPLGLRTHFPVVMASGLYVLQLQTPTQASYQTKLLVY